MSSFVPSGYLTFSDALNRVASVLHIQKREAQKTLRQLLYSGQVPSRIIENSGQTYDVPTHVWGGMKWDEALKSGAIRFEVAAYAPDAYGRIIIPQSRLIKTLKSHIPQETGAHQRGTTEAEADSAPAGQLKAPPKGHRRPGRPTLVPEIGDAYRALKDVGKVNFNVPKTTLYKAIRKRICNCRNDITIDKNGHPRGLGDEAIRRVITPLWEADLEKARQQQANKPAPGPSKL